MTNIIVNIAVWGWLIGAVLMGLTLTNDITQNRTEG